MPAAPSGDPSAQPPAALRLPAFYCPIPRAVHPGADEADAHTIAWLDRFGLFSDQTQRDRMATTHCGRLAALMAPFCPSSDLLKVYADFCTWAFAFDDDFCDEGPLRFHPAEQADAFGRMHRAIEIPEYPLDQADNYAMALRDIRVRIDAHASPVQGDRFAEWMRNYFMIELRKSGNSARGIRPNLSDYAVHRLYGGGGMVFPHMPAAFENIDLPAATRARRDIHALTEMAATVVTWDTDFFAFVKERERTNDGNNLIEVVAAEYDLPVDDALSTAMAMRDRVMCLYLRLGDAVRAKADPPLHRYSTLLDHYVRGSLEWDHEAARYPRYLRSDGTLPVTLTGWTDHPGSDDPTPLPIRSISWWWHHDPLG
ncbi:hypothetical protein [Kitasatospora sp. NPDC088351]|uniref:terpene synthase family protein n=1 Tax=unclassified Kitasatospora TaxID=2633591 RepID=UPI003418303A